MKKTKKSKAYEPQSTGKMCDCEGCTKEGIYRAPKDRSLKNFYWFCLEHVQQYNKNWNFYEGMTPAQLEEQIRLDQVGHRPTWHVHDLYANAMKDPLDILGLSRGRNKGRKKPDIDDFESKDAYIHHPHFATQANLDAIRTLKLQPPITEESVKKSYKKLAFIYHPDKNAGSKEAEEMFKSITDAYHILIKALRQD